ncbi:outer membrane lipoprotein carrier protein LolA [Ulvibacter antarcticus]|uniref:Outer membrane lipoprotein carrier protein n=1 Tax=Ulvibacter antarcticus TaxID=442714 RepID=A0A3L9ZG66_9FLAO|nr:outer membrane lipoprotein carrier protein LolA [Ulvibacter antarcticus]RMA65722.1 outer membrane lipoprotein carrier protein [Ulvibacter antarcticus]
MRTKYLLLFFVLTTGVFCAQEKVMSAAEIVTFKKQVETTSKATNTIKSDFVQYKHMDFLENDIETSGQLAFKAPGLVKWEYTKPFKYSVIFKEDKLLINDGGTKSKVDIGSSKMFKKLNELIVNSVRGSMFNDSDFDISYSTMNKFNKAVFTPKDKKMAGYIASFELLFDKNDAAVLEVKMVEPSSDFTRIVFSKRVVNSDIPDAVFNN